MIKLIMALLLLTSTTAFANETPLVVIVQLTQEQLAEQLGYCKHPAPKGHGVYYVMENGKCVARVK